MGLPPCGPGRAAAAPEGGRLRARCRVQTGRQWPSPGRPQAARESDARSNCCTRRSHDDCATATGWPGKRRPIAPLAVPLARPYRAVRPCRSAGTLSAPRVSRRIGAALRCVRQCMRADRLSSRGGHRARRSTDEWAGCERGCWRIARPFGNNDGRGRRPVPIGHWHTVRVPSQLPRTAGRREARGACGGGLRGAAHPLRQLAAAAQIGALSAPPRRHGV